MQRIFYDERRQDGRFQRGPCGVEAKLSLSASKMLDGGPHRLAFLSCSAVISPPNAANRYIVTTTWMPAPPIRRTS